MLGRSFFYLDTTGAVSFHDSSMSSGEIYFRRAARIATESPDSNWQVVAQSGLALGDYYIYSTNSNRARQAYADIWTLLSQDQERLLVRREQLEQITPLKQNSLPMYASSDSGKKSNDRSDPLLQGNVTISYEVSTRGRADNLILIEAQPAEFERMINAVQRELRRRIFRPRMQDGEVVVTPNMLLDHKFFYRQSDLEAIRAERAAE